MNDITTKPAKKIVVPKPGQHGGSRPGTRGGKPIDELEDGDHYALFYKAKAKHEICKAELASLQVRKQHGELLQRIDVELAATRLHAFLAQSLRSLPDTMERKCGLDPTQVQYVQDYIDELTLDIRRRLNEF